MNWTWKQLAIGVVAAALVFVGMYYLWKDTFAPAEFVGAAKGYYSSPTEAISRLITPWSKYTNLDSAASTPTAVVALKAMEASLQDYASAHRGTGVKSRLTTDRYEAARHTILNFFHAPEESYSVVFTKNATDSLNTLAEKLHSSGILTNPQDVVIISKIEHHANDLPWRKTGATIVRVGITPTGELDLDGLKKAIAEYAGRIKVVSITGVSNVTGTVTPWKEISELAHSAGALYVMDGAQTVSHLPVDVGGLGIDALVFSSHKLYSSASSCGILIVRSEILLAGPPSRVGGGQVKYVGADRVIWDDDSPAEREEVGSPDTMAAVSLAAVLEEMKKIGWEGIMEHEKQLYSHLNEGLERLTVPNSIGNHITIHGPPASRRVGVVVFDVSGVHHNLVAQILSDEWCIGVRAGCFCAHQYLHSLLKVGDECTNRNLKLMEQGDYRSLPGLVRVSIGLSTTMEDIDKLLTGLASILEKNPADLGMAYTQSLSGHFTRDPNSPSK